MQRARCGVGAKQGLHRGDCATQPTYDLGDCATQGSRCGVGATQSSHYKTCATKRTRCGVCATQRTGCGDCATQRTHCGECATQRTYFVHPSRLCSGIFPAARSGTPTKALVAQGGCSGYGPLAIAGSAPRQPDWGSHASWATR